MSHLKILFLSLIFTVHISKICCATCNRCRPEEYMQFCFKPAFRFGSVCYMPEGGCVKMSHPNEVRVLCSKISFGVACNTGLLTCSNARRIFTELATRLLIVISIMQIFWWTFWKYQYVSTPAIPTSKRLVHNYETLLINDSSREWFLETLTESRIFSRMITECHDHFAHINTTDYQTTAP